MTRRRQGTIAASERRTQEVRIAGLFARPRTHCRAGQRVLGAVASLFSSLQGRPLRLVSQLGKCYSASNYERSRRGSLRTQNDQGGTDHNRQGQAASGGVSSSLLLVLAVGGLLSVRSPWPSRPPSATPRARPRLFRSASTSSAHLLDAAVEDYNYANAKLADTKAAMETTQADLTKPRRISARLPRTSRTAWWRSTSRANSAYSTPWWARPRRSAS